MSRTPHKVTKQNKSTVLSLVVAGYTHVSIAKVLGISQKTLVKYYKEELETGKGHIDDLCVSQIIEGMRAGSVPLLIFYAKTKMGWREQNDVNILSDKAKPVQVIVKKDA